MKKLNFISRLDDNPSYLILPFDNLSSYQSKTSGFLSFLVYLTIILIVIYKIYDVVCLNHVYV